ncbi:MAG: C39 family peptidase [Elusimicrobia bacterium]|nr:C39 family peptidase [Elusimicrobiota bacterium]
MIGALATLALSAACAEGAGGGKPGPASRGLREGRKGLKLIRVPKTRQATDYTCGVAALQSVLGWFGMDLREDELAKELKPDPQEGTDFRRMAKAAEARGLAVSVRKDATLSELRAALDQGKPAILSVQAWAGSPGAEGPRAGGKVDYAVDWKNGHYVVAIGYDAKDFYFMDPSLLGHYGAIPAAELPARWHDEESPGERIQHLMLVFSKKAPPRDPEAIVPIE